jgi:hypothetical protein
MGVVQGKVKRGKILILKEFLPLTQLFGEACFGHGKRRIFAPLAVAVAVLIRGFRGIGSARHEAAEAHEGRSRDILM